MKAGDTVRRIEDAPWAPIGYTTVVYEDEQGFLRYTDSNGNKHVCFYPNDWELVSPNSPVRIETITRTVIEPGVYGRLYVAMTAGKSVYVGLTSNCSSDDPGESCLNSAELRELARIATELADGLDAQ